MPIAVPCRAGAKSRRMISGTAMLPIVMATPRITVPSITTAPLPAERTITPSSTPRRVSVMATSAPSLRPASEASGEARAKHSTGMPVRSPSSTGEKPSSCCIRPTTGATATNGPRMFRAMSPMAASRIQLRGTLARTLALTGAAARPAGRNMLSSVPLLSRAPAGAADYDTRGVPAVVSPWPAASPRSPRARAHTASPSGWRPGWRPGPPPWTGRSAGGWWPAAASAGRPPRGRRP